MKLAAKLFGGLEFGECCVYAEQVNPAALVYFVRRQFCGSRVPHKSSMIVHSVLPGFLEGNDISQVHTPSV